MSGIDWVSLTNRVDQAARKAGLANTVAGRQLGAILFARERAAELRVAKPLGIVMLEWEELRRAGLPVWMNSVSREPGTGCLNRDDRVMIRRRYPEWRPGLPLPEDVFE